ncbi:MAG: type IV pilus assembly protein PilM [Chlamydiae bacterium]|nr:type IV pilus assembly protein PilM [Chlamydiota bacterium]MBI3277786.1 type IV pilus assembly protein PilM [Chlamydiota bacterium]
MTKKVYIFFDFGSQNFKAASFTKKGRKLSLLETRVEKVDFLLSDNFLQSVPLVIHKMKEMFDAFHVNPRFAQIYISLPGSLSFCRLLKLPQLESTKIHQIVQYEAQQQIPFPLEEVLWDYQVLGSPDEEHLHVLLAAIRLEIVQALLSELNTYHLQVELIEAAPIAAYHAISQMLESPHLTLGLLDLGARSTHLVILAPQTAWIRTIPIGGDHFTQEIQKELKLEFQEAENLKWAKGSLSKTDEASIIELGLYNAMSRIYTRLVAEISRSLGFYNAQFSSGNISKMYLCGGSSQIKDLERALSKKFSLPIEFLNPLNNPSIEYTPGKESEKNSLFFTGIIGMALRSLKRTVVEMNLLPKGYLFQRAAARKKEHFILCAAVILLILTCQIFYQHQLGKLKGEKISHLASTQKELESYSTQIKTLENGSNLYSTQIREVKKLVGERVLWNKILLDLQNNIPGNIWLEKLNSSTIQKPNTKPPEKSKGARPGILLLTLYCKTTGTYKDVADFRDLLEKSSLFEGVQIRSANPPSQGIRDFVIQAEVQE